MQACIKVMQIYIAAMQACILALQNSIAINQVYTKPAQICEYANSEKISFVKYSMAHITTAIAMLRLVSACNLASRVDRSHVPTWERT